MGKTYDLAVIGAGSGGLSAAIFGIEVGATVAMIEKDRIGGDCTWNGCVPSKSLLKAAKAAHHARSADAYGVSPTEPQVDLSRVLGHVHEIVDETYREETPEVMREKGIDVYLAEARFLDPHTLQVGEETIRARNVVIVSGAHPFVPSIEGLDEVKYWTYESVWHMETLPRRLIVVGGGPIGSELSQAFSRLGSQVTQIEARDRILTRDEPVASEIMGRVFQQEGIDIRFNSKVEKVWQDEAGVHVLASGDEIVGDALLVSVGRRPNVDGLDLEKAGVRYSARGIEVNHKAQTSQPHIYAAGDCIGSYQFTHYAGWQGTMAARNALLPGSSKAVRDWVPWTTFTEPEVAHVGWMESQAREKYGKTVETTTWSMEKVDRARADVDTEGVVHLVHKGGKVLGVTIVSARAGELIHEWLHVVEGRLSVRDVTTSMHVYPTYSRANVKAGGALLQKQLLSGAMGNLVRKVSGAMVKGMRLFRSV